LLTGIAASTTDDAFLGGALVLRQPAKGYRISSDAVLLAALTPLRPGQKILDLGTGYGQIGLCLLARESGLQVTGLELLPEVAELARHNATANGMADRFEVVCGDVANTRLAGFDIVVCNPPYRKAETHTASADIIKATATTENPSVPLQAWVQTASAALAPKGHLLLIHDAQREGEILDALEAARLGTVQILPLISKAGSAPNRLILNAAHGDVSVVRHPPLVLHEADGKWCQEIERVLRTPLPLECWQ
jgi:tRNA1(Val) A37 N6-methylase TrmN6